MIIKQILHFVMFLEDDEVVIPLWARNHIFSHVHCFWYVLFVLMFSWWHKYLLTLMFDTHINIWWNWTVTKQHTQHLLHTVRCKVFKKEFAVRFEFINFFLNSFIQNPDIFTNIWQLIVHFRPLSSFYNSVYIFGLHMREGDWTRCDTSNIYSQRHRGG